MLTGNTCASTVAELLAELIAANDSQSAVAAPQAPAAPQAHLPKPTQSPVPKIAPEAASEPKRNAWTITRGGKSICTVCGAPMTRDEALAEARCRWEDADILEN